MKKGFTIALTVVLLLILSSAALSSVAFVSTLHFNQLIANAVLEDDQSIVLAEEEVDGKVEDEATSEDAALTDEDLEAMDFQCTEVMHAEGAAIIARYQSFLEEYFNLDIDTSEQIDNAQKYQRFVETSLDHVFEQNIELPKNTPLEEIIDQNLDCLEWRDWYKQESTVLLEVYTLRSTTNKEVFQIVDGLKTLNDAMEDFSLEFQLTFPLIFKKFDNALPCYAKQCI